MNISANSINNFTNNNSKPINFGCDNSMSVDNVSGSSLLDEKEIVENIHKLVNKIKFVSEILGENGKTLKPIATKIGDATIYIDIDKTQKDKIKVNLFSDTYDYTYEYSPKLQQYIPVKSSDVIRQSMDITINKKDKRMINGQLNIIDCDLNFERDIKTGKRNIRSNKSFYFVPNLYECFNMENLEVQYCNSNKDTNTVSSVFFNMFANLTKVKPDICLIK